MEDSPHIVTQKPAVANPLFSVRSGTKLTNQNISFKALTPMLLHPVLIQSTAPISNEVLSTCLDNDASVANSHYVKQVQHAPNIIECPHSVVVLVC